MKIKMDFVSNSSSTSFIYISEKDFNSESFFKAVGVNKESPMLDLFQELYETLSDAILNGTEVVNVDDIRNPEAYPSFTPEVIARAKAALNNGKQVIVGGLSSEESHAESLLCTEIFEIDSEDIFINAFDNYW